MDCLVCIGYVRSYLPTRLTRVVADSGAGSTNETFRYSDLIDTLLKKFSLKFSDTTVSKLWQTFVKRSLIMNGFQKFLHLVDGHENTDFWSMIFGKNDHKMTRAKKYFACENHHFNCTKDFLKSMFIFIPFLPEL